jgi:CO/xanthine dehydrogenase Mo-binding subunit
LKLDPLAFRLSLLSKGHQAQTGESSQLSADRLRRVLELAAAKAGWGSPQPRGSAMGICLSPYGQTCVACIAEVSVQGGALKVRKITIAVDCGRLINPLGAANQIEGGIVWSLTAMFYGGVPIRNGRVQHRNWADNKLLRIHECPQIEVHFTGTDAERPWGIGEVSTPVAAPAVLNAIFAATGQRIRKLPIENIALVDAPA